LEVHVAKFLVQASYNAEGVRGLQKEGGSERRKAVTQVVESLGGKVDAFYFAFGDVDAFVIVDVPDTSSGIAISMAVNASGAVRCSTRPLITPEEIDTAAKKSVSYRAPGR
jgi:uncharacterized protein with GYD domain